MVLAKYMVVIILQYVRRIISMQCTPEIYILISQLKTKEIKTRVIKIFIRVIFITQRTFLFKGMDMIAILFFLNFIYLFLAVLSLRSCKALSLVVVSGGYRFLIVVAFPVAEHGLQGTQTSSCDMWAQQLRCLGSVGLQHVESSWIRD